MSQIFERERKVYNRELANLLRREGRYVLIKGDEIINVFDTYADALKCGYALYKLDGFFVKQISSKEKTLHFTRDISPPCQS